MIEKKESTIIEKDYFNDLQKIKDTIKINRNKAMVLVNSTMILTYYEIGTIINARKIWGSKYIQNLANDLVEFGGSYSFRNLKYMSQFSKEFNREEIRQQPVAQIPWGTLLEIISKSFSHEEILWYINETYKNRWSRSQVELQFKAKAYERSLIKPEISHENAIETNSSLSFLVKDSYVLDFIDANDLISERKLQSSILQNIQKFILELGQGFSFVSEKFKLPIDDTEFEIDLLFYHIPSHSYVVIELKATKFKPEYIGQLLFYTNYIDSYIKTELDSPTIGIVLCNEANNIVCRTTLMNTKNLAISKYKILEELPKYLSQKIEKMNKK